MSFDHSAQAGCYVPQPNGYRALGRLDGSIQTLPHPNLFVAMYMRKEAALSNQISVYADKLIWNAGKLPLDWGIEKRLGKHASIPYNPDVAGMFFRASMIKAWSRGIERILDACREVGTPRSEIRLKRTGLWAVFPFPPEHQGGLPEEAILEIREKILALIVANSTITINDLANRMGITIKGIKRRIRNLKEVGAIERVGPAKGGYWRVLGVDDE